MKLLGVSRCVLGLVALAAPAAAAGADRFDLDGRRTFVEHRCNACHSVASEGIARVERLWTNPEPDDADAALRPPDLSNVGHRRTADFLGRWLRKEARLHGRTHKKRFLGSLEELRVLVGWLGCLKSIEARGADPGAPRTALIDVAARQAVAAAQREATGSAP